MPVVRILQLVGHQLERKDLLVDVAIRHAHVHAHLRVLLLAGQAVVHHTTRVDAALPPVPAVLLHAVLAATHVGVLAEDVGQPGPESFRILHLAQNLVDQTVQVGTSRRGGFAAVGRRGGGNHRRWVIFAAAAGVIVTVVAEAAGGDAATANCLAFAESGLSTVLEDLQREKRDIRIGKYIGNSENKLTRHNKRSNLADGNISVLPQ